MLRCVGSQGEGGRWAERRGGLRIEETSQVPRKRLVALEENCRFMSEKDNDEMRGEWIRVRSIALRRVSVGITGGNNSDI